MKRIFKTFFFILVLISTAAYSETKKENMAANINQEFFISPDKMGTGIWQLESYDKSVLELLEDRKEPLRKLKFKAIKTGKANVKLKYYENAKMLKSLTYTVNVGSNSSPSKGKETSNTVDKKKPKQDFRIDLNSTVKIPEITQKPKHIVQPKQPDLSYSLPERELMKNPNRFYSYIIRLINRQLYQQAISEIEKFRLLFPNDARIDKLNIMKGRIYTRLQQFQNAISWYRQLIDEKESDFSNTGYLMILLSENYMMDQDYASAKVLYVKILSLYQDSEILAKAHYGLGRIYFIEDAYQKGINELESIIQDYPDSGVMREQCLYMLGEMYYKKSPLRDYKKAHGYFRSVVEEYPRGEYTRTAIKKMKYLEKNFIQYY